MFVKHLQEYLDQFTVIKGKKVLVLVTLVSTCMSMVITWKKLKRIEVQESNIIGQNTIRVVLKHRRVKS